MAIHVGGQKRRCRMCTFRPLMFLLALYYTKQCSHEKIQLLEVVGNGVFFLFHFWPEETISSWGHFHCQGYFISGFQRKEIGAIQPSLLMQLRLLSFKLENQRIVTKKPLPTYRQRAKLSVFKTLSIQPRYLYQELFLFQQVQVFRNLLGSNGPFDIHNLYISAL